MSIPGEQTTDGLVMIALRIRDEDRREQAIHRLENLPTERPFRGFYELSIADWDEGLWEEEVAWFSDLLEGTRDRIIVWQFTGDTYTRYTIGEGA